MQPHTIKPRPQRSLENKPAPQSHRNYCEKHNGIAESSSPSGTPYGHKETLLTPPAQFIMARLMHVHIREPHLFPIADPSLLKEGGGARSGATVPMEAWHRGRFNMPSTPPKTLWNTLILWATDTSCQPRQEPRNESMDSTSKWEGGERHQTQKRKGDKVR